MEYTLYTVQVGYHIEYTVYPVQVGYHGERTIQMPGLHPAPEEPVWVRLHPHHPLRGGKDRPGEEKS